MYTILDSGDWDLQATLRGAHVFRVRIINLDEETPSPNAESETERDAERDTRGGMCTLHAVISVRCM